ncbi:hypothetical protein [Geothrix limicola]|uniref:hypothetical protein n=1 Tax=Geothrix limicola TaxID=2927978 RepID=UPI00255791B7|nr:hypothetical protein [Geothrix limicola]
MGLLGLGTEPLPCHGATPAGTDEQKALEKQKKALKTLVYRRQRLLKEMLKDADEALKKAQGQVAVVLGPGAVAARKPEVSSFLEAPTQKQQTIQNQLTALAKALEVVNGAATSSDLEGLLKPEAIATARGQAAGKTEGLQALQSVKTDAERMDDAAVAASLDGMELASLKLFVVGGVMSLGESMQGQNKDPKFTVAMIEYLPKPSDDWNGFQTLLASGRIYPTHDPIVIATESKTPSSGSTEVDNDYFKRKFSCTLGGRWMAFRDYFNGANLHHAAAHGVLAGLSLDQYEIGRITRVTDANGTKESGVSDTVGYTAPFAAYRYEILPGAGSPMAGSFCELGWKYDRIYVVPAERSRYYLKVRGVFFDQKESSNNLMVEVNVETGHGQRNYWGVSMGYQCKLSTLFKAAGVSSSLPQF